LEMPQGAPSLHADRHTHLSGLNRARMRIFTCNNCGQLVFFENSLCLSCGSQLGYVHERRDMVALVEGNGEQLSDIGKPDISWQRCATAVMTGCNWLVPASSDSLCESCVLTRTRPAYDDNGAMAELVQAEVAKRRLIFQLAELGLPLERRNNQLSTGVAFDLLSSAETKVITGHDNGIITLDLAEADSEHRERLRLQLNQPYRTLLGHFRHEIGHYYWPILVHQSDVLLACRELFGDDRADYGEALQRHYHSSADDDQSWQDAFISRYATMHPYEDWAETFAHYLHILDTLQTAESFGLGIHEIPGTRRLTRRIGAHATRPDGSTTFDEVVTHWLELSYALNQISRSMGQPALYPFVLAPGIVRKLSFVDNAVRGMAT
jgi:hypothetical protein